MAAAGGEARVAGVAKGDGDERSDRRGFFKLGWLRAKDTGVEAARAVGQALDVLNDALNDEDEARHAGTPRRSSSRPSAAEVAAVRGAAGGGRAARPVIRPPGALPEAEFLATCEQCQVCVDACPEEAISITRESGAAGPMGTPLMKVQFRPCHLCEDVPCSHACPTGALRPIDVRDIKVGRAVVYAQLCINPSAAEPCESCLVACPVMAISQPPGQLPNIDGSACTGCGQCVVACPTYPAALNVVPL